MFRMDELLNHRPLISGTPKVCSGYLQSFTSWVQWTDRKPPVVSAQDGTDGAMSECAPQRGREWTQSHPCHLHHHRCCCIMPAQLTCLSVYRALDECPACQGSGTLKCESVGREGVDCGKNLPSKDPYIVGRERERGRANMIREK